MTFSEHSCDHVEGGLYTGPEFLLGEVYDGDQDGRDTVVLYRPVYVCIDRPAVKKQQEQQKQEPQQKQLEQKQQKEQKEKEPNLQPQLSSSALVPTAGQSSTNSL
jgi:hypothetical protein